MSTPAPSSSVASLPETASPVLRYIHTKFREVFGEPFSTLELDSQWSLRSEPSAAAIFLLVNGSYEKPAVWIFDPFAEENVWRASVTSNAEVDDAIEEIKRHTKAAKAGVRD
jgi:hypothetical protein